MALNQQITFQRCTKAGVSHDVKLFQEYFSQKVALQSTLRNLKFKKDLGIRDYIFEFHT